MTSGGDFAQGANLTIAQGTHITLLEDIQVAELTIQGVGSSDFADSEFSLSTDSITLEADGRLNAANVDFSATNITLGERANLRIRELGTNISLAADSTLIATEALVSGALALNITASEASSTLHINASATGTTLSLGAFVGNLNVESGIAETSKAQFDALATLGLYNNASYSISDALDNSTYSWVSKITGEAGTTLSLALSTSATHGTDLDLGVDFQGTLNVRSGALSVQNSNLGGTQLVQMGNGSALYFDESAQTKDFATAIAIDAGATVTVLSWGQAGIRSLSNTITGGADTRINKSDLGDVQFNNLSEFEGTLGVMGGKLTVSSAGTAETPTTYNINKAFLMSGGTTFEVQGHTILNATGRDASTSYYTRRTQSIDTTITVGEFATFNDNVYMRIGGGSVTINGGGEYNIYGFMGTDHSSGASTLNIAAGTTVTTSGTATSDGRGDHHSFLLSHWSPASTVNVAGTLDIASGISNMDGTGNINVNEGGTLILRQGLYGEDVGTNAGSISINAQSGSKVQVANQANASGATGEGASVMNANFAAGSTIEAIDATTHLLQGRRLTGTNGNATLRAAAGGIQVNVMGLISNISADSNTGLTIAGSAGQNFSIAGANTYTGGTSITGGTVTMGNASALGAGAISISGGTLNMNNMASTNAVTASGGNLAGFSAYAGALSVTGAVAVADTITGNISISDAGSLTLSGTWDFSSAMSNEGTLLFDNSLMLDLTGSSFDASNNLTLFTGSGSANITDWLNANSADLSQVLTGVDTEGKTFSYNAGVLSYTMTPAGDIIIGTDETKALTGAVTGNISFDDSTGVASLGTGFSQGESSEFIGAGTILIAAGSEVTLSKANTQFSGETEIEEGTSAADITTLTMGHTDALGKGDVLIEGFATLAVNEGVALQNDVELKDGGRVEMGNIHLSKSATSTSLTATLTGAGNSVMSTSEGGSINNATLTDMAVQLRAGKSYTLSDITLSGKYDLSVTTSLMRSGVNTSLTINNLSIEASVDNGTLIIPTTSTTIDTTERADQEMYIYGVSGIAGLVAGDTSTITGDLTLTLTLTGSEFADFMTRYNTENGLIGFALEGVTDLGLWYHDVEITIENSDDAADKLTLLALGATKNASGEVVLYIPEPSTATLGLLALAGLLARRRRKVS